MQYLSHPISTLIINLFMKNQKTNAKPSPSMEDIRNQPNQQKLTSYPVIDLCFTSRAHGLGMHENRQPLLKYRKKILSSESQFHNEKFPDYNDFETIQKKDGLIHFYRDLYIDRKDNQRIYTDSKQKKHYYGPKVLIVVCMYNEGIGAINLTLKGIYKNLISLKKEGIPPEQIAVVLVQDGILKLVKDRETRTYEKGQLSIVQFVKKLDKIQGKQFCELQTRIHTILDSIDDFKRKQQQNLIKQNSDFPPNIQKLLAMMYQNQWKPEYTETLKQKKERLNLEHQFMQKLTQEELKDYEEQKKIKLNIFTCFKHKNGKKLSSHLWFFQGFCRYLQPEFVVLLDVGTTPGYNCPLQDKNDYNGLTNLLRGFYADKDIGGCTGLMSIDSNFPSLEGDVADEEQEPNPIVNCLFSIQKAQQYEYIMAHFLDKNFESATGFLHVLPGAWSAYRYIALIKSQKYQENLLQKSYFTPILNPEMEQKSGYEEQNMYLAEDRILSLGIYCQQKSKYTLYYVPDGVAYTDPMKEHKTLLGQRRRWINSSLFAFLYVWRNYYFNILQSDHNCYRSYVSINISMVFAGLSFLNSYFTPSLYFFVIYITIAQLDSNQQAYENIATIVSTLYCFIIIAAIGGSLVGKQWESQAHIVSGLLSIFTFAMLALVTYNILVIYLNLSDLKFDTFRQIVVIVMVVTNLGSFVLILVIHVFTHFKFIWKLLRNTVSYLSFQGAYSQTMVIYGMCNVDDVSWGTKGASGSGQSRFFTSKVFFVSSWLFYNCILAYILIYVDLIVPQRTGSQGGIVLLGISIYATVQIGFKTILATLNFLGWLFFQRICRTKFEVIDNNVQYTQDKWKELKTNYNKQLKRIAELQRVAVVQ